MSPTIRVVCLLLTAGLAGCGTIHDDAAGPSSSLTTAATTPATPPDAQASGSRSATGTSDGGATARGDGATDMITLDYVGDGQPAHAIDLHRPAGAGPHPVLVWVHGGGWMSGDQRQLASSEHGMDQFLAALLERGYAVASVNYRLSNQARFPAQIHDVNGAIRHLRRQAADLGLDPARMAVAGDSAGGHLALLAAMGGPGLAGEVGGTGGSGTLRAVVSFYGVTDIARVHSDRAPLRDCPAGPQGASSPEGQLLGVDPGTAAGRTVANRASPLYRVAASQPPVYLTHGRWDCIVPAVQSERLHAAIQAKGGDSQLTLIDASHSDARFYTTAESVEPVLAFLERHL